MYDVFISGRKTALGYFSFWSIHLIFWIYFHSDDLPIPNVTSVEHVNATAIQIVWEVRSGFATTYVGISRIVITFKRIDLLFWTISSFQFPDSNHISFDSVLIRLSETNNPAAVVTNAIADDKEARNYTFGQLNPLVGYTVELANLNSKGFSPFSEPYSLSPYSTAGTDNSFLYGCIIF